MATRFMVKRLGQRQLSTMEKMPSPVVLEAADGDQKNVPPYRHVLAALVNWRGSK